MGEKILKLTIIIIIDEEIARVSSFCRAAEIDFYCLAGPRNVSIDLKYNALYV